MKRVQSIFIVFLCITIVFSICLTSSVFAENNVSEQELHDILKTTKEGLILYDILGGYCMTKYLANSEDYKYKDHMEFIQSIIDIETDTVYDGYEFADENGKWICVDYRIYNKAGAKIKNLADLNNIIDQYFMGIAVTFDDESTVKSSEEGYLFRQPTLRIIDGQTYIMQQHVLWQDYSPLLFDKFEVASVDGDNAIVNVVGVCPYCEKNRHYQSEITVTVELEKVDGNWKIGGGSFFEDECTPVEENWYSAKSPSTGENTTLYIAIAGAAVVAMTSLVVRRKKKIA